MVVIPANDLKTYVISILDDVILLLSVLTFWGKSIIIKVFARQRMRRMVELLSLLEDRTQMTLIKRI